MTILMVTGMITTTIMAMVMDKIMTMITDRVRIRTIWKNCSARKRARSNQNLR